ncbi:hypothetical protein ABZ904_23520 [Streptomyces sp. NPDC046900]
MLSRGPGIQGRLISLFLVAIAGLALGEAVASSSWYRQKAGLSSGPTRER